MVTVLDKSVSIFKAFLDIVLPPICYICRRSCSGKYGLCQACLGRIRHVLPKHVCSPKNLYIEKGWFCCYYEDTIKESIHLFKYRGFVGLIDIFSDIMVDFVKRNRIDKEINLIVPVPMYSTKRRERSYNHAEVLARSLSKYFAIPLDAKNLRKIKWTPPQSELDKERRIKNVKDSFLAVDKKSFSGKNVLLVDDVYTTGATINECAKVLHTSDANKVFFLTLARGV